jgi:hypothetical protein
MSRRSSRRVAALLSAIALTVTGIGMSGTAASTITAGGCCAGHK